MRDREDARGGEEIASTREGERKAEEAASGRTVS